MAGGIAANNDAIHLATTLQEYLAISWGTYSRRTALF
jgi:hypothetical protein